jgi:hypothetical protein
MKELPGYPENRILLAFVIRTIIVYNNISLYLAFNVRKKEKG